MSWEPQRDALLASVPFALGYPVLGDCVLYERLGAGAMGTVYRAYHLKLRLDVAVKCMRAPEGIGSLERDEMRRRFLSEATFGAAITHQNLVGVKHVGSDYDVDYLVMDYVEGENARERQRRKGSIDPHEAASVVRFASLGLAEVHRRVGEDGSPCAHRDVKPANLMVATTGRVKVLDFGLARSRRRDGGETAFGGGAGTPEFMPPEQFECFRTAGPRADVWSLGATLYALISGRAPFRGEPEEIRRVAAREDTPDLAMRRPDVPRGLCEIVARCMRRDPEERYADAAELAAALLPFATLDEAALADPAAASQRDRSDALEPPTEKRISRIVQALAEGRDATFPHTRIDPRSSPRLRRAVAAVVIALCVGGAAWCAIGRPDLEPPHVPPGIPPPPPTTRPTVPPPEPTVPQPPSRLDDVGQTPPPTTKPSVDGAGVVNIQTQKDPEVESPVVTIQKSESPTSPAKPNFRSPPSITTNARSCRIALEGDAAQSVLAMYISGVDAAESRIPLSEPFDRSGLSLLVTAPGEADQRKLTHEGLALPLPESDGEAVVRVVARRGDAEVANTTAALLLDRRAPDVAFDLRRDTRQDDAVLAYLEGRPRMIAVLRCSERVELLSFKGADEVRAKDEMLEIVAVPKPGTQSVEVEVRDDTGNRTARRVELDFDEMLARSSFPQLSPVGDATRILVLPFFNSSPDMAVLRKVRFAPQFNPGAVAGEYERDALVAECRDVVRRRLEALVPEVQFVQSDEVDALLGVLNTGDGSGINFRALRGEFDLGVAARVARLSNAAGWIQGKIDVNDSSPGTPNFTADVRLKLEAYVATPDGGYRRRDSVQIDAKGSALNQIGRDIATELRPEAVRSALRRSLSGSARDRIYLGEPKKFLSETDFPAAVRGFRR